MLDLKVNMNGSQDVAYSKVYRTGSQAMSAGAWRVSILENGSKLREVFFTVQ